MEYGLMLYDIDNHTQEEVAFGNQANIIEARSVNRIRPIHYGVDYHQSPLEFTLVFGSMDPIDRYDMQVISMWLTGHQTYQWLTIGQPDMADVMYRCLATSVTPIHIGWLPYAFEATFRCDSPYAYSYPFTEEYVIKGKTNILFRNMSSVREYLKPNLIITPDEGVRSFTIVNRSDQDRRFAFENLPASSIQIEVDNTNGIIREVSTGTNLYGCFNLNFFRLVSGDNQLEVTGNGRLTIAGRYLYNVGA